MNKFSVSFVRLPRGLCSVGVVALLGVLAVPVHAVTIDLVTVGDPGNTTDTTNRGAVATSFQIMKYEWTNSQYVDFLNAVDASGTNPNSVYNTAMGSDVRGGISFTSGASPGSKYATKTNMGDKPVNYVSWWDAARVANWLQNGQGSGSTETGPSPNQPRSSPFTRTGEKATCPARTPSAFTTSEIVRAPASRRASMILCSVGGAPGACCG
jgi:hypothetical protein